MYDETECVRRIFEDDISVLEGQMGVHSAEGISNPSCVTKNPER